MKVKKECVLKNILDLISKNTIQQRFGVQSLERTEILKHLFMVVDDI